MMIQAQANIPTTESGPLVIYPANPSDRLIPVEAIAATLGGPTGERVVAQAGAEQGAGAKSAATPAIAPLKAAAGAVEDAGAEGVPDHFLPPLEMPNWATLIEFATTEREAKPHEGRRPEPEPLWFVNPLFTIFYAVLIVWVVRKGLRRASLDRPGRLQNAVEMLLGGLRNFFLGIMGPEGEKFIPYVGSLWLFIWINNVAVLVPGFKSPSSSLKFTFALGIMTFFYVQFNAIKYSGMGGWIYHLLGSPTDVITWILSPMFLVLEIIGELVKPVSLSLRLFGNIFGEDVLLASFLGMGMVLVAVLFHTTTPPVGIPLHLPFYFLVLLLSTIQATVFSLLAAIYVMLLMPHREHGEGTAGHGATGEAAAEAK